MDAADAMRAQCRQALKDLTARGLLQAAKWIAELAASLPPAMDASGSAQPAAADAEDEDDQLALAKTYFDVKEYLRCANLLSRHTGPRATFLRLYARFLAGEKEREEADLEAEGAMATARAVNGNVGVLKEELSEQYESKQLDAFGLYLYGVVLREQGMDEQARSVLAESVNAYPWNWSAWTDLARLCTENETVQALFRQLEPHWMRYFFLAYVTLELQQNEQSLEYYSFLSPHFPNSTYISAQIAIGNYNMREFDQAQQGFEVIQVADPYRLEDLDAYSNILYVKGNRAELSHLAHRASRTDKYRPETCCIIGNYYSLKQEHEKAVLYFRRALKLDKNYLSAWTLMGHEYVELKNTPAAVEAYRRAVEINPRDYRAWYGLGQTYEILRLPFYSLYYYHKATQLRPYDARMWTAMGGCYEELNRAQEAIDCYQRAGGKKEGDSLTLFKLAKLYVTLDDLHAAAKHYMACLYKNDADEVEGGHQTIEALLFLANYHKEAGRLDQAEQCCSRLLDYTGHPREEARAIMREIRAMHMHNPVARQMEGPL